MPISLDLNALLQDPQITAIIRITLAGLVAGLIGLERELAGKAAGIRTYGLVAMGAAVFTVVPIVAFGVERGSGVIGFIISGIGFLGAGTILHTRQHVVGLTTAAGMWASGGLGMAMGLGLYWVAIGAATVLFVFLQFSTPEEIIRERRRRAGLSTIDPEDDFVLEQDADERKAPSPATLPQPQPPIYAGPASIPAPPAYGPWSTGAQQPQPRATAGADQSAVSRLLPPSR